MDEGGRAQELREAVSLASDLAVSQDGPEISDPSTTPIGIIAIDLTTNGESRTVSRAEAIVELIVKSDRVFLDGACWRCTEHMPAAGSDVGLCVRCLAELKDPYLTD
jgi:hypothetical protein